MEIPVAQPVIAAPGVKPAKAALEAWRMEELRTKKATYLLNTISTIEAFYGESLELELFLEDMEAVHELIRDNPIDPASDKNILRCFVGRISKDVLMETGIRSNTPWATIKTILKERYGGARAPPAREALGILRTTRKRGETPAEFARRIGERARLLRRKLWDLGEEEAATRVGVKVIEELVCELVLQQIPERMRNLVRGRGTSLEEVLLAVRHEEEDAGHVDMEVDEGWQVAPRRRQIVRAPPRRVRSPPRGPRPERRPTRNPPTREVPRRTRRGKQEGPVWKDNRECWQCQETGHISRNCPYIYRRDRGGGRPPGGDWRGEPMEVNATTRGERRRIGRRVRGPEESADTGEDTSPTGSESEKEARVGQPPRRRESPTVRPRRWESPNVRASTEEEEVRA